MEAPPFVFLCTTPAPVSNLTPPPTSFLVWHTLVLNLPNPSCFLQFWKRRKRGWGVGGRVVVELDLVTIIYHQKMQALAAGGSGHFESSNHLLKNPPRSICPCTTLSWRRFVCFLHVNGTPLFLPLAATCQEWLVSALLVRVSFRERAFTLATLLIFFF
jgi:hypothetical protein